MEDGVIRTVIGITGKKGSGKTYAADVICQWFDQNNKGEVTPIAMSDLLKPLSAALFGLHNQLSARIYTNEVKSVEVYRLPCQNDMVMNLVEVLEVAGIEPTLLGSGDNHGLAFKMVTLFIKDYAYSTNACTPSTIRAPQTLGWVFQVFGTEIVRNQIDSWFWVKVSEARMRRIGGTFILPDVRFPEEEYLVHKYAGKIMRVQSSVVETDPKDGRSMNHASETEMEKIVPDFTIENNMTSEFSEKICEFLKSL